MYREIIVVTVEDILVVTVEDTVVVMVLDIVEVTVENTVVETVEDTVVETVEDMVVETVEINVDVPVVVCDVISQPWYVPATLRSSIRSAASVALSHIVVVSLPLPSYARNSFTASAANNASSWSPGNPSRLASLEISLTALVSAAALATRSE